MARILIIDDDNTVCDAIANVVEHHGHETTAALTLAEAQKHLQSEAFDVVFLDVRMPDGNGLDLLPTIRQGKSEPEVIIITGYGDPNGAELAMKNGAWDYIEKPASRQIISLPLLRALEYREKKTRKTMALDLEGIVGNSAMMKSCYDLLAQAAGSEVTVMVSGETGTGKELFAQAIHKNSARAHGPFVVVDCAALPETLVESVLFGHTKGSFTSADRSRTGLLKQADSGTLFLDEVAELPVSIQSSFLRALQERRFRPVGSHTEVTSNFRIISATNRDIDDAVGRGRFREDLLFRLRGLAIELPPLRTRWRDIKDLSMYFVNWYCEQHDIGMKGFSPDFWGILNRYDWPGNARELFQALEHALVTAQDDPVLFPKQLPPHIRVDVARRSVRSYGSAGADQPQERDRDGIPPLREVRDAAVAEAETEYLRNLMKHMHGNIRKACTISGLSRSRLYALLKKYDIDAKGR